MRWIETDSTSNISLVSAVAIGTYTADADRLMICDFSADQVAGNGDYTAYLTRQIAGTGSAYVLLPKTTMTAASGETAIGGQSGYITVRTGDVLTVYLDGLAGDTTTPDTIVRWYELAALRPTTADRTLDVAATGEAGLDFSNIKAATGATTLTNITVPTVTTVSGLGSNALTSTALAAGAVSEIWAAASRTLTMTAAQVAAAVSGAGYTMTRGDTLAGVAISGISDTTGYVTVDLTVKASESDSDNDAIMHIRKNASGLSDGLLRINGAAPSSPLNSTSGSLTVASTTVTPNLSAAAAATLPIVDGLYYDVQVINSTGVYTRAKGIWNISGDVTRAVS